MISEGVYTTGRLSGNPVDEQSLVLKGENCCYVVTGCSHPGVEKILKIAKNFGNIKGIIGGFHNFKDFSLLKNLDLICPCHCTKQKKDIKKIYPEKTFDCGVGKKINLDI